MTTPYRKTRTFVTRHLTLNAALWAAQVLLATLFLFAGISKLVLPPEAMSGPVEFPILFLRFIGGCEALGALGLILPWFLRIHPELTSWAAVGLVVIMLGATLVTLAGGMGVVALIPALTGGLAAFVGYGRHVRTLVAVRV